MADKSNKVLYIDNVTTYDYIKNYMKDHTVDEPNNSKFTYVVFTEYTRPNNYGVSYHGDIFFNGKKIHKPGYVKDFHDRLIHMANPHFSLAIHDFIGRKQHPETGG